ncbi:MAG TPA: hypothetical protein VNP92_13080 [Actinophytocola sp.]|nr:hypothetical protein [Actinophytocola sp.]
MSRFGARRYLLDRVLYGARRRRYDSGDQFPVRQPRSRGRFGFWGPVPYYSRRTRRGAEVSVGGCGCCLPIPLLATVGAAGALRTLWRRVR